MLQSGTTNLAWPCFIVTLQGDDFRREPLVTALQKHNLPFKLHYGVDGRGGLSSEWEPQIDRCATRKNVGRDLTDAEFACALSHRQIYQKIIDQNLPGAIVLEDDAIVTPHFRQFIESRAYEGTDLLMLDHWRGRINKWTDGQPLIDGISSFPLVIPTCLTTGYTISRRAAEYIVRNSTPLCGLADWPCDITPIGARVAIPRVIEHADLQTATSHIRDAREIHHAARKKKDRTFRHLKKEWWIWKYQKFISKPL